MLTFVFGLIAYIAFITIALRYLKGVKRRGGNIGVNRLFAVVIAVVGIFVLSALGLVGFLDFNLPIANRNLPDWFVRTLETTFTTVQVWSSIPVYLAWAGAQLLGSGLAGVIIGISRFKKPLQATLWVAGGYYFVLLILRIKVSPLMGFADVDPSGIWYLVNLIFYLLATSLLIGGSALAVWLMTRCGCFSQSCGRTGAA